MSIIDLGDGFYLKPCQLGPDFKPFWKLMERRRYWFDKMHSWSEGESRLIAMQRRIKCNRAIYDDAKSQPDSPGDAFRPVRWLLLSLLILAIIVGID